MSCMFCKHYAGLGYYCLSAVMVNTGRHTPPQIQYTCECLRTHRIRTKTKHLRSNHTKTRTHTLRMEPKQTTKNERRSN